MDEKEFEEKQEQQGKTDSVQEEQAVESAQEEPVSAEDTTKDHEPEEEKTEDSMTDEEKEALEKAKAADHAKEQREKEIATQEVVDNVNKKSLQKRIGLGIVNAVKKVAYVALTPVRWVGDRVIELTMPKESRAKMYSATKYVVIIITPACGICQTNLLNAMVASDAMKIKAAAA